MSKSLKVALGVALLLFWAYHTLMRIPAEYLTVTLTRALPALQLSSVSGSVWTGRAGNAYVAYSGQALNLGTVKWQFQWMPLLALKACVNLDSERLSGLVCRHLSGQNEFQRLQLALPAKLFDAINPAVKFSGNASLNIVKARVDDRGWLSEMNGNASWQGANISVNGSWFTLGDFGADLTQNGSGALAAAIFDLSGPFGVKLNGLVGVETAPSVEGTILPKEEAPTAITDVLGLVAAQQEDGSFRLKYPL